MLSSLSDNFKKNKNLYFILIDLEKAFDRVPSKILWWGMLVVSLPESIVVIVQVMYNGAKTKVRVNGSNRDDFEVKFSVYQGSVLSRLIFILVLETLSREFRTICSWELLYVDDLSSVNS